MSQTTLRQIPGSLDRRLRALARQPRSILNKTIISLLPKALRFAEGSRKKRDLRALAGTWNASEAADFEKNTRMFEKIDLDNIWES